MEVLDFVEVHRAEEADRQEEEEARLAEVEPGVEVDHREEEEAAPEVAVEASVPALRSSSSPIQDLRVFIV